MATSRISKSPAAILAEAERQQRSITAAGVLAKVQADRANEPPNAALYDQIVTPLDQYVALEAMRGAVEEQTALLRHTIELMSTAVLTPPAAPVSHDETLIQTILGQLTNDLPKSLADALAKSLGKQFNIRVGGGGFDERRLIDLKTSIDALKTIIDERLADETGTPSYKAGTGGGTVSLPAGARLSGILAAPLGADGTLTIAGGDPITVRKDFAITWNKKGNYVGPLDIVFSAQCDYYVSWLT